MPFQQIWSLLAFVSLVAVAIFVQVLKPSKEKIAKAGKMGLFLAVFDWVFQTLGFYAGYWWTNGGFLIGPAVPLEVSIIAFCVGAVLSLLQQEFLWKNVAAFSFIVAFIGAFCELAFVGNGDMIYANGWASLHAFVTYFLGFTFFQFVNSKL